MLCLALVIAGLSSCHKLAEEDKIAVEQLENINNDFALLECAIPISGTISSNTTWTTGNVYLLQGIVEVNGAKLTIQPGVVVLGEKSSKGGLVINRNAEIDASGTECSPIIFTSDQAAGSRAPGDWFGLALLGNAPNNQSNSLTINIHGTNYTAGGSNATSSVGILKYVQIHYAGSGSTAGAEPRAESALILGSIGSGSVIDHIQISNSARDGMGIWGGEPTVKYAFNYQVARTDFRVSYGTKANMQFLLGFKDQVAAYGATDSHGMEVTNGLVNNVDDANAPYSYPTISQMSLLGGDYCAANQFNNGIQIQNRGNARIYNSVVSKFRANGLFLDGTPVVANTGAGSNPLQFSYNAIDDIGSLMVQGYGRTITGSWVSVGGCGAIPTDDMSNWILGTTGATACRETSNDIQLSSYSLGYANSLCGNKCSSYPSFELDELSTDLQEANYDALSTVIFSEAPYIGALQPQGDFGWIQECNWIDFCMQTTNYCA